MLKAATFTESVAHSQADIGNPPSISKVEVKQRTDGIRSIFEACKDIRKSR